MLGIFPSLTAEAQVPPAAKLDYLRGSAFYKARKFAAAAQAFSAAYAKYPSTRLMYDLGQTYRKQGQFQQALQSYEQFLTEPGLSPGIQSGVRSYIGELRAALGKPVSGPVMHPKVMPDLLDPALGPKPAAAAPAMAAAVPPGPPAAPKAVAATPPAAPYGVSPSPAGQPMAASIAPTMPLRTGESSFPSAPTGLPTGPAALTGGIVESLPRRQLPGKWAIIDPKPGYTLRRAYCNPADVFVVGDSSTVLAASDGQATFGPLRTGLPNWFSAVWGTTSKSGASELFIGGDSGMVLRRVGPQLHAVASGIHGTVFAFAGSANDWFAFGESGAAARFDGTSFVPVPAATAHAILGAFAVDSEIFAVGAGGAILRWGGASFTSMPSPSRAMLQGIWGPSKSELWAVGSQGTILRFDGAGWRSVPSGTQQTLLAVWGTGKNDVFAVGTAGIVLHYDGTSWAAVDVGAGALLAGTALSGLCGRPGGELFATGDNLILRYKK